MEFVCNKNEGRVLGQLLRKYSMMQLPTWRPIGFKLEKEGTNILYADANIIQSMIEFGQELSELQFDVKSDKDLCSKTYTFRDMLMSENLSEGNIECQTKGVQLLHNINSDETLITIYYRKSSDIHSISQNLEFLQEKGEISDFSDIKVIASIHSEISKFKVDIESVGLDQEKVTLDIDNIYGNLDKENTVKEIIHLVKTRLDNISGQLG